MNDTVFRGTQWWFLYRNKVCSGIEVYRYFKSKSVEGEGVLKVEMEFGTQRISYPIDRLYLEKEEAVRRMRSKKLKRILKT